jgi:hypothetical protein
MDKNQTEPIDELLMTREDQVLHPQAASLVCQHVLCARHQPIEHFQAQRPQ